MMIATILLIANLASLIWKDSALFSFWHFAWIYPVEILLWVIIWIALVWIAMKD